MNTTTLTEPMLTITESAANQIQHLLTQNEENTGKHLRVYVEAGGCSGKQYGLVFDIPRADDHHVQRLGITVLVDPISAGHLRGSTVDFADTLNSSGFKITNPNARQSCGCGNSFET